ncbi:hypothetical protein ABIA39_003956 [Nocardia sp. GAS34]|uniref:hypothetical protein n=1 Tax=unclassified Nocardia TaxID=2637762 RepID=UPI003D207B49
MIPLQARRERWAHPLDRGSAAFAELRQKLIKEDRKRQAETAQELAARREREERDRLAREEAERTRLAAERANPASYGRHAYAQPSDWTDQDDALEDGAPMSCLS